MIAADPVAAADGPPASQKRPSASKVALAVGSTLGVAVAALEGTNPHVAFYLLLASTLVAHFAAYLGWTS